MPLPHRHRASNRRFPRPSLCTCVAKFVICGAAPVASRLYIGVSRPRSSTFAPPIAFPHPHPLLAFEFARRACRRSDPADARALLRPAGCAVRRTISRAALSAVNSDAALRDAGPRNSTEPLAPPCTSTGPRVAIAESTRLAISSTLFPSPERAGCQRSSRCDPSFSYAPARS